MVGSLKRHSETQEGLGAVACAVLSGDADLVTTLCLVFLKQTTVAVQWLVGVGVPVFLGLVT